MFRFDRSRCCKYFKRSQKYSLAGGKTGARIIDKSRRKEVPSLPSHSVFY